MINKLNIEEQKISMIWEGKKLEFKSGKLAPQTGGSIIISLGDLVLLVTATFNKNPNQENDFMPLTIEFNEKYYASGKIGGSQFNKREGKPSIEAILNGRLTDRPIRPMFPEGMINDVVVTITPLSMDKENLPGVVSIIGTSLAIMSAGIPFEGPVGATRIGYKDGNFIVNPTYKEIDEGIMNLVVAGSEDTITMVECGSNEIDTEILLKGFELAQTEIKKICQFQKEFLSKLKIEEKNITLNKPSEELLAYISQIITKDKLDRLIPATKKGFNDLFNLYEEEVLNSAKQQIEDEENQIFSNSKVKIGVFKYIKKYLRKRILEDNARVDGRNLDDIRPLYCEVGLFSRIHGTGLFQRGETQVMTTTTLGAPGDVEIIDSMEENMVEKKFIHHYNMPPFANNEAKPVRFVNRREIGHGKLAEKSIIPMLPNPETFPYTIRLVSEVLSSNGSTSMASVCASTLSLMDAGVPIKKPVSGIAMGLITDENLNFRVLTDIQGLEDFIGDMDFKVAGTKDGITALQMDMKIKGLKLEIIKEAIEKANIGRLKILEFMLQTIERPREQLNPYAPKIYSFKMDPSKIREVIGPGGEVITKIIKETNVKIDFDDEGTCVITSLNDADLKRTLELIEQITWTPSVGDIRDGIITRVENYGVFVNIGNNKIGLCHVKQLGEGYIADPSTIFKIGDKIKVSIYGLDKDGKIQLKKVI